MKKILFLFCVSCWLQTRAQQMKPIFNGKDLSGWYSFLRTKGKNNDPEKVFTVSDSLLHVSGKEFGYICTDKVYENFHLIAEFKWGTKKYPPRDADTTKRDNGICYFVAADAKDTVWPKSIECQIQEGDVGDIWLIDSTTMLIEGARTAPKDYQRVIKLANAENSHGEWNRIEVIVNKGRIKYVLNGMTVNEGVVTDLTQGKILIQSEGAEIFYRNITIAEL